MWISACLSHYLHYSVCMCPVWVSFDIVIFKVFSVSYCAEYFSYCFQKSPILTWVYKPVCRSILCVLRCPTFLCLVSTPLDALTSYWLCKCCVAAFEIHLNVMFGWYLFCHIGDSVFLSALFYCFAFWSGVPARPWVTTSFYFFSDVFTSCPWTQSWSVHFQPVV